MFTSFLFAAGVFRGEQRVKWQRQQRAPNPNAEVQLDACKQ